MPESWIEVRCRVLMMRPRPWSGHPPACKYHPRPNLVVWRERHGFLWLRSRPVGICTECGWRVREPNLSVLREWDAACRERNLARA